MPKGFQASLALVLVLVLVSGCGYTLGHRLKPGFASGRGIFIPMFDNDTEETGVEKIFTDALVQEVASRSELKLVSPGEGGLELRGILVSVSYVPTAMTQPGFLGLQGYRRLATEYGVEVAISLTLVDPDSGRIVWSGSFRNNQRMDAPPLRTQSYEAPSSVGLQTLSALQAHYAVMARNIMRDVYDEMLELFD